MRLILTENSFKFNDKPHYLQTDGVAIGSLKSGGYFLSFFVAHFEKQLVNASPYKPFLVEM